MKLTIGTVKLNILAFSLALIASLMISGGVAYAKKENSDGKIMICHITQGAHQYVPISVSQKSLTIHGHINHEDIIPPFNGYDGRNWDEKGRQTWDDLCKKKHNHQDENDDNDNNDEVNEGNTENGNGNSSPGNNPTANQASNSTPKKVSPIATGLNLNQGNIEPQTTGEISDSGTIDANDIKEVKGDETKSTRCPWWWIISVMLGITLGVNYFLSGEEKKNDRLNIVLRFTPLALGLSAIIAHEILARNFAQTIFCRYLWLIAILEVMLYYLVADNRSKINK